MAKTIQQLNRKLTAALSYAKEGWAIIPLHTPTKYGKCSCKKINCPTPGKHPRISKWQNNGSTSYEQIHKWWKQWPDANIGLIRGTTTIREINGHLGVFRR